MAARALPPTPPRRWNAPKILVKSDEHNNLEIDSSTASLLRRIPTPLYVVAVAGRYRTGKSFLLNKLAGTNGENGFSLGSTVQSKTKGIWVFPLAHPRNPKLTLLLMDTEGLDDIEKGDETHDRWIFVLAVLLSNVLIHNTQGVLSQDGLQQLHFVANMTEYLRTKVRSPSGNEGCDFREFFPELVVCIRDFTLRLEIDGKKCSADEYLEHCLSQRKPGKSKQCREFNQLRENIADFFPQRRCFAFPPPTTAENIQCLDQLGESQLDFDFVRMLQNFSKYVLSQNKKKSINGISLNGEAWVSMAVEYVNAQKTTAVPCIENSLNQMVNMLNQQAMDESIRRYNAKMREETKHLPVEINELANHHQTAMQFALKNYGEKCVLDKERKHAKQLNEFIERQYDEWVAKNEQASKDLCRRLLKKDYRPRQVFLHSGGHAEFLAMIKQIQASYKVTSSKGPKANETFMEFLRDIKVDEDAILQVDHALSEAERREAELQNELRKREEENKAKDIALEQLQAKMSSLSMQYKENETMLKNKINVMDEKTKDYEQQLRMLEEELKALEKFKGNEAVYPKRNTCLVM